MKIAAIQYRGVGDTNKNIHRHIEFIEVAVRAGANVIYFPELSITGYEPKAAKSLVMEISDNVFDVFQTLSDMHKVIVGIGVPIVKESYATKADIQISMIWFQPHQHRTSYAKQLLHDDETPFFVSGEKQLLLQLENYRLAPAICYESLQPIHCETAVAAGADIYLASVAKSASGMGKAMQHYAETARKHKILIVTANSVGPSDDFVSAGNSSVWDQTGKLLAQMDTLSEGVLIFDTDNNTAIIINTTSGPRIQAGNMASKVLLQT